MKATCSNCRADREMRLDGTVRAHPGGGRRTCPGSHRPPASPFVGTTPEENGSIIAAMDWQMKLAALAMLSVRHPEIFADAVAWAMQADARTAQYTARTEAGVPA